MPKAHQRGDGAGMEPPVISRRPLLKALWTVPVFVALGSGCATDSSKGSPASSDKPYELPSSAALADGKRKKPLDFGLAYSDTLPWMSDVDLAQALDDAADLGVGWIRADLSWTNIQPDGPDQYLWERFDRIAKGAQERDLKVLATLGYSPQWAGDPSCGVKNATCPPADNERFAQFASEAVTRYAAMGVHAWQVWNEANIKNFWQTGADPKRYTDLLAKASAAIRAADPEAFVLMCGLANSGTSEGREAPVEFLDHVLEEGAGKYVDGISFHPFARVQLPSTKTGRSTYEKIKGARQSLTSVLARHDLSDLEIWLTETGAPTHGNGAAADNENPGKDTSHATYAHQARIAADVVKAADELTAVTKVFWYSHRDTEPEEKNAGRHHYYGLIEYGGKRKPAFDAYRDAVADYRAEH
ncbi:cellulase family glycosylhydrolase [Streptomyces sp. NPDC050418]|uniref:cellulase family glycosylhydrolase n=1 Tax=Streptomyces sp. NPDC050418 TaxID=3365612 RepID=UPI0037917792